MNATMYAGFSETVRQRGASLAAETAANLGCSSVEPLEMVGFGVTPTFDGESEAKALRAELDARGLHTACYSVGVNLWQEGMTPDTVTPMEEALYHHARMAAALGSPFLHHTVLLGVPADALTIQEALHLTVPAAIRIAKYAHSLGLICLYEGQGMYFNGVEGYRSFYEAVKQECPYVGVCGDIGNPFFVDEDSLDFFQAFAKEIRHVHIKDYLRTEDRPENTMGWNPTRGGNWLKDTSVGQGCVKLPECLQVLKDVHYTGAYALEDIHGNKIEMNITDGIRYLKSHL